MKSDQLYLELLFLVIVCISYLILRYFILRRSITYPEFEKWFLASAAISIIALILFNI